MSYSQSHSHSYSHSSSREGKESKEGAGLQNRKQRKKVCRFCADYKFPLDYKEPKILIPFLTERGKMIPRRVTGNCAFHQRRIQEAIKRARILALIPFTTIHQP